MTSKYNDGYQFCVTILMAPKQTKKRKVVGTERELLVDFDARVTGGGVSEDGSGGSKAVSIFVKYNTAFIFDEL